ncbi:polysaccharide pyruvyl transferase family protein [Alteribacillus sp. YIM 98480]|uniref:polysaccharide pyruvyl transferase family protein n=1 Tax=Alteribacillus sp. YIM 98480 TaxID=2606599 RepID=UPI00131A99B3|nr:polysaccharide pyruvyl transferase family protein [Alteribacillus sp. YIM 98480]
MKIGILTFHDADNYGAVLQAYALKESIQRINNNWNVQVVDYKMSYIIKNYKLIKINTKNPTILIKSLILTLLTLKTNITKKIKFNRFRNDYMNLSDSVYHKPEDIKEFDSFIIGSDQVWNFDITKGDSIFFLDFCNEKTKKISYAASIGNDKLSLKEINHIKKNINNIDNISVREHSAVNILNKITDKHVHRVLDPTLLADITIWNNVIKQNAKTRNEKYILVYMVSTNEEVLKTAELVSKKKGLKVLLIHDSFKNNKYGFQHLKGIGPVEFVQLIKNAEYIVTNSFHGTTFSIIFNKNFITIPHKVTGSRMNNLLELLNLEKRLINKREDANEIIKFNIDYTLPNMLLKQEKEKSLKFLVESLNKE